MTRHRRMGARIGLTASGRGVGKCAKAQRRTPQRPDKPTSALGMHVACPLLGLMH
jgi:hypothetical protein